MKNSTSQWKRSNDQYGSHFKGHSQDFKQRSTLQQLKAADKANYLHEQENIAQKFRHGLFSQPMGLSGGDHYHDAQPHKPSKRVEVNQRMHQKVGPQLFSKPTSTNIGDPYKDSFRANQLYHKQKVDLNIHQDAFLAPGNQKTIKHSQFDHKKEYDDKVYNCRGEDGKVKVGKKGVLTGNMKNGLGNTTNGLLFQPYPYMGSPYEALQQQISKDKLQHKAKILKPFVQVSHPSSTFTPDYVAHQPSQPFTEAKGDGDDVYRAKSLKNWKYNNPGKKGVTGSLAPFPQYIEQGPTTKNSSEQIKPWIPNFNGTSKQSKETLSKPCPVPSQMTLNILHS